MAINLNEILNDLGDKHQPQTHNNSIIIDVDNILCGQEDMEALKRNMSNYVNNNIIYDFNQNNHLESFERKIKSGDREDMHVLGNSLLASTKRSSHTSKHRLKLAGKSTFDQSLLISKRTQGTEPGNSSLKFENHNDNSNIEDEDEESHHEIDKVHKISQLDTTQYDLSRMLSRNNKYKFQSAIKKKDLCRIKVENQKQLDTFDQINKHKAKISYFTFAHSSFSQQ